jgi:hypothetical protein
LGPNSTRLIVVASALLWACGDPELKLGELQHAVERSMSVCVGSPRAVDILLVVDGSPSMADEAANLAANMQWIMSIYDHPDVGPDYRIAVTTTDAPHPNCDPSIDRAGRLVATTCRARIDDFRKAESSEAGALDVTEAGCLETCPLSTLDVLPTTIESEGEAHPRPWIEDNRDRSNLPPGVSATQALACLGPQGVSGCEAESPIEAARQALLRSLDRNDPAFGFIRPHAALFLLFITDEDAPPGDIEGFAIALSDMAIEKQKWFPVGWPTVWVRVIGGVPGYGPEVIDPEAPIGCSSELGTAQGPVRLAELARTFAFESVESLYSICQDDWALATACVPDPWRGSTLDAPVCFDGCAADSDPTTQELEPECTVSAQIPAPDGANESVPVDPCSEHSDEPCYRFTTGWDIMPECVEDGFNLQFKIENPQFGACYSVTCTVSANPDVDCPSL